MSKEYYKKDLCDSNGNCKLYNPLQINGQCVYYNEWCELKGKISDLEAKLAEQQECSLKASAKHNLEMQNAQICVKELEAKLAEKEKEFDWLHQKFAKYAENNQDKISFALEQLEKVKEFCDNPKYRVEYEYYTDCWTTAIDKDSLLNEIDNQIKQLKEMPNEK